MNFHLELTLATYIAIHIKVIIYVEIKHSRLQKPVELLIESKDCKKTENPGDGKYGYDCYEPKYDKSKKTYHERPKKFP
uniref:Uncharacterized protein n=1 Tax=Strongyloides papillosus TaxID=174720 RepID=A0A0N5C4J7_STREA